MTCDAKILEGKHMIAILLYLHINDGCKKIDIYNNVSNNPRIPEKLDALESAGLISQTKDDLSRSMIISLTDKGRSVATSLTELDKMMKTA